MSIDTLLFLLWHTPEHGAKDLSSEKHYSVYCIYQALSTQNVVTGPVDTFLSWKALVPLSRLTYCLYLVHVVILPIWLMSLEVDYHYVTVEIPIYYLGKKRYS